MGASISAIACTDDQIQAVDNLQDRLDGLKHVLHDLQQAVNMLKNNDDGTPRSILLLDRESSSAPLRPTRSHVQSPLCQMIPPPQSSQDQGSTGSTVRQENNNVTLENPSNTKSPKPLLLPPPPAPPPPLPLPRRGRVAIPPPPPPPPNGLIVSPSSPGESGGSTASSSSVADVERKLDALYKIMTRTLSLVQSGGVSGGGSTGNPALGEHGLPEWTGPKTRPPADEDPEGAQVYDAREEMLRELRERVAVRRKALDANPQQD